MGKITFVSYEGEAQETTIVEGQSLMQIATSNGVTGIDGDCGGECACGTCHVIVDGEWVTLTGKQGDDEEEMLELTPERQSTSRLSCQITVSEEMDGMTVHLPEFQM
ncbi:2Fe-2S iron-sulfur cluster binding domain-containing protein [Dietzia sp. SLG310A2-38A2]|uniref:2Fe-2S iron-sulfur cluster-binding protein n=1 Tax=Dietzia sp. SLG310A2-38A2 TaxID=1630643 RepID=UPI0015FA8F6C|nr:2Fe-2S iron-sulfur cluster-binding protein [Dietzia sp. SLG310A2-38A2]MBB1032261.1 2Fe-2S iron-sulfur cluster binding domain-containing protein [Dietzia sp. SLG310A2-38A2]